MPEPKLALATDHIVTLSTNPTTGEDVIIDTAQLNGIKAGDKVIWSAEQAKNDFKIVLPDNQVFGLESFTLSKGARIEKKVAAQASLGLGQDYVIFSIQTSRKVKTMGGVEPTIIIGG